MHKTLRLKYIFAALLTICTAIYLIFYIPIPFIKFGWAQYKPSDTHFHIRHRVADYIIITDALAAKGKSHVINLLGEPSQTSYFSDWDLVYHLGTERGIFSIDSEWLVVNFDANNNVSEVKILRD